MLFPSFFSMRIVKVRVVHRSSCTETATAWKKSRFILSEESSFKIINSLSIVVHIFPMCTLTQISVDEILLPSYVNWYANVGFKVVKNIFF